MYGIFPLKKTLYDNNSPNSRDWHWVYEIDAHYFGLNNGFKARLICHKSKFYIRFSEPCYDVCFPDFKSACARLIEVTVKWYFNYDRKKQTI